MEGEETIDVSFEYVHSKAEFTLHNTSLQVYNEVVGG